MNPNIKKAYEIIDEHLPHNYSTEVMKKLPKDGSINSGMIRNVKKKLSARLDILNAMVEVALEHKNQQEKLKKLTA